MNQLVSYALNAKAGYRDGDADTNYVTAFHQTQDPIHEEDASPALGRTSIGMGVAHTGNPNGYNAWNASPAEAHAAEILRGLREEVGEETFEEWALGVVTALRASAVLRPLLYGDGVHGPTPYGFTVLGDSPLPREESLAGWTLRVLRQYAERRCSPQERRLAEQRARELATALSELPQQNAPVAFMRALWEASQGVGLLRQALSAVQEVGRSADGKAEPAHAGSSVRRLTPAEAERLQALPDGWTAHGPASRRYAALGDAVTSSVAEWIGRRLMAVAA